MGLDVRTEIRDDLTLVTLTGELDVYTVSAFRHDLEAVDAGDTTLAIDLSDVTLLDSSGIGALVSLLNQARETRGGMGLICPQKRLRRVFEIAGLRRAFAFADDLPSLHVALADAAGEPGS